MKVTNFAWDEWNIEHIAKHNVTPQEVEEACYNQPIIRKTRDNLYLVYGQTDAGQYLFVVIRYNPKNTIYVVTARPMTKNEQRFYSERR